MGTLRGSRCGSQLRMRHARMAVRGCEPRECAMARGCQTGELQ